MNRHVLSRDQVRNVDRRAIEEFGMPGVILMENAGRGAAELLMKIGIEGPVVICAGKGNNGGDGFVIARHLENHRYLVKVLLYCAPEELKGDAAIEYRILAAAGTPLVIFDSEPESTRIHQELSGADWIVDALLGTGTEGNIREPFVTAIECINSSEAKVLAVDLPSGLDCDQGTPLGPSVRADHTATFVARKLGFENLSAAEWTGTVHVIDIGVPRIMMEE